MSTRTSGKASLWLIAILCGVVLVLLAVGVTGVGVGVWYLSRQQQQRVVARQELKQQTDDMQRRMIELNERALTDGELNAHERSAALRQYIGGLRLSAAKLTGAEADILNAGADTLATMQPALDAYGTAYEPFARFCLEGVKGHETRAEFEERIALVDACIAANEKLTRVCDGLGQAFERELIRLQVPAAKRKAATAGFTKGAQIDKLRRLRDTHARVLAGLRTQLEIYRDQHGKFKVTAAGIEFEDESVVARFQEAYEQVQAAAREQEQLQREMLQKKKQQ